MSIQIEKVQFATDELAKGLSQLLPQLSSTAPILSVDDVERLINSEAATLFVARDAGALVGTLTLIIFSIPTGRRAWIEDVVVDATARGRGVGEALTITALNEAKARGARTIDLTSRPAREAANALYQKVGFSLRDTNVYRLMVKADDDSDQ
ncbi:MAG TPA: GNAT family N-acetyltransferase [Acidimicrobiales bacterium]